MSIQLAGNTYVFERRWLPAPDGSLTLRSAWTNVPRPLDGASPFDWAGTSRGAYDLALNILEDTLRASDHAGPSASHAGTTCLTLSLILRDAFVERFIAPLPDEGGTLAREAVAAWITSQVKNLDPLLAEILAPRFAADNGETWTAAELQQILGTPMSGEAGALAVIPHPLNAEEWESCPL